MKVKELIEELQKCNPDANVDIAFNGRFTQAVEVDVANPESCASPITIIGEK